ncbi:MAG: hypothetical protein AB1758_05300 [Candidatus Eremiobacterota bacterium]
MTCRRALTLLETLTALGLFGLSLVIMAGLAREYGRLVQAADGQEQQFLAAGFVLERIRSECQEAVQWVAPRPGGEYSDEVVLVKVDPLRRADRLPPVLAPDWSPLQPAYLVQVRYSQDRDRLWRQLAGAEARPIGRGISGLSARWVGPRSLELRLSIGQDERVRALSTLVYVEDPREP